MATMWNRFKLPSLKSRSPQEVTEDVSHPSEVLASVREQHPNLSVFHNNDQRPESPAPPMPTPIEAKGSRRFTLLPKQRRDDGHESLRIHTPSPGPQSGILKKKSSPNMSDSPRSLSRASAQEAQRSMSPEMTRRPSQDVLRPSIDSGRTTPNVLRRPSLDMIRSADSPYNDPSSPANDAQFGSVRSILRDPNTPGTGQNVRFFSRDAYKVMTPEQSMDLDAEHLPQPVFSSQSQRPPSAPAEFPSSLEPSMLPKSPKALRPTLNEVFSPIGGLSSDSSMSFSGDQPAPLSPPNTSNIFDVSQEFQLPTFPPPGLDFDFQVPSFNPADSPTSDDADEDFRRGIRTSTPNVNKGKGKERALVDEKENTVPLEINEAIFHRKEKTPRLPALLHERSQSFSFGKTTDFFSTDDKSNRSSNSSSVFSSIHSSQKSRLSTDSPSPSVQGSIRGRSRAFSDTMFHSMLSSSSSPKPAPPETDINDESSSDLQIYSPAKTPEPDPFRANATTYYTPQTMIPVTPPRGAPTHARTASKEETVLMQLQTQLGVEKELCMQYETDLRARDELVELLQKRLGEVEQEDIRRKGILRGWKKKVVELEKTCRYLEEEVDSSRQESLNRSALDEASGFALAAMQEQIAALQRERSSWQRKEEMFRDQINKVEALVRERNEEVTQLKSTLEKRDESERELQRGIQVAQEQMEQLSNMSLGFVNEEDLQRAMQEKEEDKEKFEAAQEDWERERAEYELKVERYEIEKAAMKDEVDAAKKEVEDDQEELRMLKAEVEAQWRHSEKAAEKMEALQKAKAELEHQREEMQQDISDLHQKIDRMEVDYTDSANKCTELEHQLAELWDRTADLENERNHLQKLVNSDEAAQLSEALQERDRHIEQLMQSHHEDLDQMEASYATNQANLREELEAELEKEREQHHLEISRVKQERDQEKAELHARYRREEEKAYHEKMAVRQERDRALQDVARLEHQATDVESLKAEMAQLRGQIHELKNDSANKEMSITSLQKQREKDKADIEGLNIALDSKQQELGLIKRQMGVKGTAGATPARSTASSTSSQQRRQSTMATPRSRPSSVISDSGGRDSVMSTTSTTGRSKLSNEKPSFGKNPVLSKSTRPNTFGTPTPSGPLNKSVSQRTSVEGSMGPPPNKLRASLNGPGLVSSRVASLNRSSTSRPSSTASIASTASTASTARRPTTEQTLAKARPAPTKAPISEVTSESEYDEEKENLKKTIPVAA